MTVVISNLTGTSTTAVGDLSSERSPAAVVPVVGQRVLRGRRDPEFYGLNERLAGQEVLGLPFPGHQVGDLAGNGNAVVPEALKVAAG